MTDELQQEGEEQPHLLRWMTTPRSPGNGARMSRRGLQVSIAGSAEEPGAGQADVPDYAVLDLKMEGDSGPVLLPKLLELDPEMRVLILTGYSSIATAVEAIKRGACNYLCKPADADDVLAALLSQHADLDSLVPETRCRSIACSGAYPARAERARRQHLRHCACAGDASADLATQAAEATGSSLSQRTSARHARGERQG